MPIPLPSLTMCHSLAETAIFTSQEVDSRYPLHFYFSHKASKWMRSRI